MLHDGYNPLYIGEHDSDLDTEPSISVTYVVEFDNGYETDCLFFDDSSMSAKDAFEIALGVARKKDEEGTNPVLYSDPDGTMYDIDTGERMERKFVPYAPEINYEQTELADLPF